MRATTGTRVVLSYGMGVESTAILLRWLEEPETCPTDPRDIVVVTAMVGDEYESTAALVVEHVLPRMRAHGVRFVQVARAGHAASDGIAVLSDSRETDRLFTDGAYKLSQELREAATIPTTGGVRKCSLKFKGFVLDSFLTRDLAGAPFLHTVGFNVDETRRVKKDIEYGGDIPGRTGYFPLVEWGWTRDDCLAYIRKVTGAEWRKSCCSFCPFSRGSDECLCRYQVEPEAAALAMELEHVALAFNPRMKLFSTRSVRDAVELSGNTRAIEMVEEALSSYRWSVYRMDRVSLAAAGDSEKRGRTERCIRAVESGLSRAEAEARTQGGRITLRNTGKTFPRIESALVAAPSYVLEKAGRFGEEKFRKLLAQVEDALANGETAAPVQGSLF